MVLEQQEAIIEAVLFSMGESVELEKIAEVLELSKEETKNIIYGMMKKYEKEKNIINYVGVFNDDQFFTNKHLCK